MQKRLFFALEIHAPWPRQWPEGRLMQQPHLTLAFLGSVSYDAIQKILPRIPRPPFLIGPRGCFDASLPLPKSEPRLIAWHVHWLDDLLSNYQKELAAWLKTEHMPVDERPWLFHVTVCRNPVDRTSWSQFFTPLPCFADSLHLYESLGHSTYQSLWSYPLLPPFEEIEHMADAAFQIYGEDVQDLYPNALIALAFKAPSLLNHWEKSAPIASVEDVVMWLNRAISQADQATGCPLKAVSFHGDVRPFKEGLLQWEMIVDI